MTRLLMAGFEIGDSLAYGADLTGNSGGSVALATSTPSPRNGTYCLKTTHGQVTASSNAWAYWKGAKVWQHASKTELWYAFGFFSHHTYEGAVPSIALLAIRDSVGNINTFLALDGGVIRAYVATAGGSGSAGTGTTNTLLGTSSVSLTADAWHLIEVHLIASTGATGTCEVWQDGALVFSATSVRTCQSNATFNSVELCCTYIQTNNAQNGSANYHGFDDFRMNDTSGTVNNGRLGDGKMLALVPNGVGTTLGGTALTPTGTTPNYTNVDEIPPSTTDYNAGSTVATGETYALADPSLTSNATAVNIIAYALNADNGGGSIGITTKTGAGTSEGTAQPITSTATYYNRLLETDPADSGTWTNAKLIALEAGITVR